MSKQHAQIMPHALMMDASVVSRGVDGSIKITLARTNGDDASAAYTCGVLSHIPRPKKGDSGIVLCSGLTAEGEVTASTTFVWMGRIAHMTGEVEDAQSLKSPSGNNQVRVIDGESALIAPNSGVRARNGEARMWSDRAMVTFTGGSMELTGLNTKRGVSYKFNASEDGTFTAYGKQMLLACEYGMACIGGRGAAYTFTGDMAPGDFQNAKSMRFFGVKTEQMQLRSSGPINMSGAGIYMKLGGCLAINGTKTAFGVDAMDGDITLQTGVKGDLKFLANSPLSKVTLGVRPAGVGSSPMTPEIVLSMKGLSMGGMMISMEAFAKMSFESKMLTIVSKISKLESKLLTIDAMMTMFKGKIKLDGSVGGPTGFCGIPSCLFTGAPHTTPMHMG